MGRGARPVRRWSDGCAGGIVAVLREGATALPRAGAWAISVLALGAGALVAYLALRSSPWVGELSWLPAGLADWADHHGRLRNLPAFAGLTAVLVTALGWRRGAGCSALLAVGLECAQLGIRGRSFDPADIGWSLLGVVAIALPAGLAARRKAPAVRFVQSPVGRDIPKNPRA